MSRQTDEVLRQEWVFRRNGGTNILDRVDVGGGGGRSRKDCVFLGLGFWCLTDRPPERPRTVGGEPGSRLFVETGRIGEHSKGTSSSFTRPDTRPPPVGLVTKDDVAPDPLVYGALLTCLKVSTHKDSRPPGSGDVSGSLSGPLDGIWGQWVDTWGKSVPTRLRFRLSQHDRHRWTDSDLVDKTLLRFCEDESGQFSVKSLRGSLRRCDRDRGQCRLRRDRTKSRHRSQ